MKNFIKNPWSSKGQIISKRFFLAEDSSKKRTKTRRILVKTNSFVPFLKESSAWQFAFEINWPLVNLFLIGGNHPPPRIFSGLITTIYFLNQIWVPSSSMDHTVLRKKKKRIVNWSPKMFEPSAIPSLHFSECAQVLLLSKIFSKIEHF